MGLRMVDDGVGLKRNARLRAGQTPQGNYNAGNAVRVPECRAYSWC